MSSSSQEQQYLSLVREVLNKGEFRPDRTGTGTLSLPFPPQHRYSLSKEDGTLVLPLFTTKRVFLRPIVAELLWFISGDTKAKTLQDQRVKIWDGNSSRSYFDSLGLTDREEGDLGPIYGFQWRHFGAEYTSQNEDYSGKGVDQLAKIVHQLKTNPYDRRIILTAWNPVDLPKMSLPPCHLLAQFYVSFPDSSSIREDGTVRGTLSTLLYQRSCDLGLGVPFNVASYSLLTHMLAKVCDLIPGELIHTMGDAHVYLDHQETLREQLDREPRDFPLLLLPANKDSIDNWKIEDFQVSGYHPHPALPMRMSV